MSKKKDSWKFSIFDNGDILLFHPNPESESLLLKPNGETEAIFVKDFNMDDLS